jgi:type II secretory pathway component PulM
MLADLPSRLDARQQRLLMGGGLVLSAAVLFSYVLLPPLKAYRSALEAREVLELSASQGQAVSQQLAGLQAEVEAVRRELHGDMANLPEKQLESFVIGRLQGISWRNNVELMSVEPAAGETVQMFSESLFKVTLSGDYFDLYGWLQDINTELGFVVIKEYEMRPLEDVPTNPRLAVNLTIASYRATASS